MTRIEALRSAIDALAERSNTLRGTLQEYATRDGDPSDEERAQFAIDLAEFNSAGPELERMRGELAAFEAVANAPEQAREVPTSPTLIVRAATQQSMRAGVEFGSPEEVRSAALRAAESEMVEVTDQQREAIVDKLRRLDTIDGKLSRHVIAHSRVEYRSAFNKMMTATITGVPARLTDAEHQAMDHARAVTITSGSAGTAIPTPLDPSIILTGTHAGSTNPWRQVCRNVQTMSNTWNGVSSAGITVGYGAEGEEASDNAPTLTAIAMTLYRGRGLVPFSIEAEQDWAGLQSEMMSMFQVAKDDSDESVFSAIAAPATNTPSGFPYLLVTNWSGQIVASTTANAFVVGDVHALEDALAPRFRMNAKWLAAQATYSKIRLFDTSGGAGLWEYIGNGRPNRLLGHDVYESPSIDSTFGSGENYTLFLGDFSQAFIIGDRLGTTVELIPHLFGATNNLPTGQRALFMNWRTGTQVGNQSAAVVLNVT
jgi:HK97 family phage major capsid protein